MNDTRLHEDVEQSLAGAPDLLPAPEPVGVIAPANDSSPQLPASLFLIPVDVIEHVISRHTVTGNIVDSLPVRHHFSSGCYARELTLPAGTLATARRHLTHHLCIISAGEITVWEEGRDPVVLTAPCTFVGTPGTRRIGYAHADTVWTTVFPNPGPDASTDPAAILDRCTEIPTPRLTPSEITAYLDWMDQQSDPASRLMGTIAIPAFTPPEETVP